VLNTSHSECLCHVCRCKSVQVIWIRLTASPCNATTSLSFVWGGSGFSGARTVVHNQQSTHARTHAHTILKTDVLCYYAHCMLKITKWSQSTPKFFFVISFTLHKLYAGFMCLCCKLLLLLVSFKTYTNFQYFSNTEICLLHSKIIWKAGLSTWSKKSFTNCADQLNVNKMIKISVDPNTSVKIRFLLLFLPFFPRDVLTMPSFFFLLCFYTRPV